METNKLTPRQWRLYNLVKDKTINDKQYLTKETIAYFLPDDYKLEHNTNEKSSFTNCPAIYNDIREINLSSEIEKIIVVKRNKIYLGDETDTYNYACELKAKSLAILNRYWTIRNKCLRDGQGKLISCQGKIIDENSKARNYVEAFVPAINK